MNEPLRRLGVICLVVSGITLAGAYLFHPADAPPETVASGTWLVVHAVFMVALLTGIFGLVELHRAFVGATGGSGGSAGTVGFVMAVTSLVFIFGLDYAEVFIFPTLAVEFPAVVERYGDGTMMPSLSFAFPATGLLFLAGFLLFTAALDARGVVTRQTTWLMVVGAVVFTAGLSGFLPLLVVRVGALLFGCSLLALARDLYNLNGAAGTL